MHYLTLIPTGLAALVLCVLDVRTRTVPRSVVLVGLVSQILTFLAADFTLAGLAHFGLALFLALCSGVLQALLGLVRPGSVGLGDATALVAMSFGIAYFHDLTGVVCLWAFTGLFGLAGLGFAQAHRTLRNHKKRLGEGHETVAAQVSIAFVPAICAGALLTYLVLA